MYKVLMLVLLLASCGGAARRHSPKFPKVAEGEVKKVPCSMEHEYERNELMDKSRCGPPREVLVPLKHYSANLEVIPSAVWVRRCAGTCDFSAGASCQPTDTRIKYVPVRIYDESTEKESCSMFPVEEHVSCSCCARAACEPPRVYSAPEYEVESI